MRVEVLGRVLFVARFVAASLNSRCPDALRASERLDPGLLQVDQTPQVVGRDLPVQLQRGARQTDRAQRLAAQLRQSGEHVLHASAGLSDAFVAPLLGSRDGLAPATLALNMHAPTLLAQPRLALTIDIALVGQDIAAGVAPIEHVLEVQGVMLAGRADLDLADQLVALVGLGRDLVSEVGLAMFF